MTDVVARPRIMFVDDEPEVLAGLRNLLYKDRKRWDLVFVLGAVAAIAELGTDRFDVVVSDMRMPQMDGAALLLHVRAHSPNTVRIMLSGHADREAIVRALPALHQLLSKPCDATALRTTLQNTISAIASTDLETRRAIGRIDAIPTTSVMRARLQQNLDQATPDIGELVAVVACDPGIASKTLQLVNSAYFGSGRAIASIEDAVTFLGVERMRYIARTNTIFTVSDDPIVAETQRMCEARAVAAASRARPEDRALASTAALLSGVENAAALLAIWGIPPTLVDLVRSSS